MMAKRCKRGPADESIGTGITTTNRGQELPYDVLVLVALAIRQGVDVGDAGGVEAAALDIEHWGLDAYGRDETDALEQLTSVAHSRFTAFLEAHGDSCRASDEVTVVSHQTHLNEEGAYDFERESARVDERARTLELHGWARADLLKMLRDAAEEELDWADPDRELPSWAWWDTPRKMAWHCAITETRYYLGRLGIAPPDPFAALTRPLPAPSTSDLLELLFISQEHVRLWVERLPDCLVVETEDEVWTTRKVLRRLAGHERDENHVTASLLAKARRALHED